jgi:hypothetical protein
MADGVRCATAISKRAQHATTTSEEAQYATSEVRGSSTFAKKIFEKAQHVLTLSEGTQHTTKSAEVTKTTREPNMIATKSGVNKICYDDIHGSLTCNDDD